MYLTSNNSWQGITSGDWPQYTPTKIELDCKEKGYAYMNTIKVSEQLFVEGVDDSDQCWAEEIKSGSCPVQCMFVNFAGNASKLPTCQTIEEVTCIIDEATRQKSFTKCNQKKRILTFNGDLMRLKKYQDTDWKHLIIGLFDTTIEIKEEIDMITASDFIGSIGGSLGMFFGFSFSGFVLCLMDKLAERQIWIRNSSQSRVSVLNTQRQSSIHLFT